MASLFLQQAISGCRSTATQREVGVGLFSQVTALGQEVMISSCVRKSSVCMLGIISSSREQSGTGTGCTGRCGVLVHGGVQEPWGCGTEGRSHWAWWGCTGLGDLGGPFQPQRFHDSGKEKKCSPPIRGRLVGSSIVLPMESFQICTGF